MYDFYFKNFLKVLKKKKHVSPPLHEALHAFDSTSHLPWHNHFPLNCMINFAPSFLHACKVTNLHCIDTLLLFSPTFLSNLFVSFLF